MELQNTPHRRYNPLLQEWVLVSPHRSTRPWQGKQESLPMPKGENYDPGCYLCPGNTRSGGSKNDNYQNTFVFTNDFSALLPEKTKSAYNNDTLFQSQPEQGICKVICFSPDHSLTIPLMELTAIENIVRTWINEYESIGKNDFINYIQIFENKGEIMGCSNPHPHGQIWASKHIPDAPLKEQSAQKEYLTKNGNSLLADYLTSELVKNERIVIQNSAFVALVPYWAVWPYETIIISRRIISNISELNNTEITDFAKILKELTTIYDNLFETSFPYSAGIHQAPTDGENHPEWHFHMHFFPPLLRSATVKKFMVGYELLAGPQRDITPEAAAQILSKLPRTHYSVRE